MELATTRIILCFCLITWRLCDIIRYVINICDDTIYICYLMCDWSLGAHKIIHYICFLKVGVTSQVFLRRSLCKGVFLHELLSSLFFPIKPTHTIVFFLLCSLVRASIAVAAVGVTVAVFTISYSIYTSPRTCTQPLLLRTNVVLMLETEHSATHL
jgi:hypothetical protein